jgi:peptide/nickel transport system substrate-binding protein
VVAHIKPGRIFGFDAIAGNTYIVPKHIWDAVSDPTKYADSNPVGSGPFTVQSCTPQLAIYVKNVNYWQPLHISKVIYPDYLSNDSANRDMESPAGNGGFGADFIPNIQQVYVAKDPAHRTYWNPVVNNWSLFPNDQDAVLKNPLVRQAISFAVNRAEVSRKAEYGFAPPAHQTGNISPFAAWRDAAAARYNGGYPYSPSKAVALLRKAGYVRHQNGIFYTKAGQPLSMNIMIVGAYSDSVSAATIMSQNLRAIGIQSAPEPLSVALYGSNLAAGKFTLAWSQVGGGVTPYYEYYNFLDSTNSAPLGKPAASDYERWMSPATDRILSAYGFTRNVAKQHRLMDQIQMIMAKDVPVIPVVQGIDWAEWSSTKLTGWPSPSNPYVNPCNYCLTDMAIGVLFTHLRPR